MFIRYMLHPCIYVSTCLYHVFYRGDGQMGMTGQDGWEWKRKWTNDRQIELQSEESGHIYIPHLLGITQSDLVES